MVTGGFAKAGSELQQQEDAVRLTNWSLPLFVALGAPAVAADNSFAGKTIIASISYQNEVCDGTNPCVIQNETLNRHVYFGTNGDIFDFSLEKAGIVTAQNKPRRTKKVINGFEVVFEESWSVKGNTAANRTVVQSKAINTTVAHLTTFTINGGQCTASTNSVLPGARHRMLEQKSNCRLLEGRQ